MTHSKKTAGWSMAFLFGIAVLSAPAEAGWLDRHRAAVQPFRNSLRLGQPLALPCRFSTAEDLWNAVNQAFDQTMPIAFDDSIDKTTCAQNPGLEFTTIGHLAMDAVRGKSKEGLRGSLALMNLRLSSCVTTWGERSLDSRISTFVEAGLQCLADPEQQKLAVQGSYNIGLNITGHLLWTREAIFPVVLHTHLPRIEGLMSDYRWDALGLYRDDLAGDFVSVMGDEARETLELFRDLEWMECGPDGQSCSGSGAVSLGGVGGSRGGLAAGLGGGRSGGGGGGGPAPGTSPGRLECVASALFESGYSGRLNCMVNAAASGHNRLWMPDRTQFALQIRDPQCGLREDGGEGSDAQTKSEREKRTKEVEEARKKAIEKVKEEIKDLQAQLRELQNKPNKTGQDFRDMGEMQDMINEDMALKAELEKGQLGVGSLSSGDPDDAGCPDGAGLCILSGRSVTFTENCMIGACQGTIETVNGTVPNRNPPTMNDYKKAIYNAFYQRIDASRWADSRMPNPLDEQGGGGVACGRSTNLASRAGAIMDCVQGGSGGGASASNPLGGGSPRPDPNPEGPSTGGTSSPLQVCLDRELMQNIRTAVADQMNRCTQRTCQPDQPCSCESSFGALLDGWAAVERLMIQRTGVTDPVPFERNFNSERDGALRNTIPAAR